MALRFAVRLKLQYDSGTVYDELKVMMNMAEKTEQLSFFQQLHRLANRVDSGAKELQLSLDKKNNDAEDSHIAVRNILNNLIKETKHLKQEGLSFVASFEEKGSLFSHTLTACQEFLTIQRQHLTATEEYLEQYGYERLVKDTVDKNEDAGDKSDDQEVKVETGKDVDTVERISSADKHVDQRKENRTPRLENVGISSFTMNLINKMKNKTETESDSVVNSQFGDDEEEETVPSIFQHNGLTLTPSVWDHSGDKRNPRDFEARKNFYLDSACKEGLNSENVENKLKSDIGSTAVPVILTTGDKPINKIQKPSQIAKIKNDRRSNSPMDPLYTAPGANQVSSKTPKFETPGAKQINKVLKPAEETRVKEEPLLNSPVPPVFITPGAKQIKKSIMEEENDKCNFKLRAKRKVNTELFKEDDREPEPPEITMSLQDLNKLTETFNMNTQSVDLTEGIECSIKQVTPVKQELLSEQLEKLGMLPLPNVTPQCATSTFKPVNSRIPRPPKPFSKFSNCTFTERCDENVPPFEK